MANGQRAIIPPMSPAARISGRSPLLLTGKHLTPTDFYEVVFDRRTVTLSPKAARGMQTARNVIRRVLTGRDPVYGVTTGFGKLADQRISHSDIAQLQLNLVRSHSAGVGDPLSSEETRGLLLLRAHVLARGYSGVRPLIVEHLLTLLNHNVLPIVPCRGSVGASGDLAPLAHLTLVLIGEGEALVKNRRVSGHLALKAAKLKPLQLEAKEGLSLVNGTQGMLSLGLLSLRRCQQLLDTADVAGALSVEALKGTPVAFDPRIQQLRPYRGQRTVAANLSMLMAGSAIRQSHMGCPRVQDAYSLRCMPQVHGAVRDALDHVRATLEIEMNSVTDNPLVFSDRDEVVSGGNFHGQPLGLVLDYLAIAITELASISERRIERLTNPEYGDLPPFLSPNPGLHSGFMLAQVTAAALASENKVLSHPASVDSIPTSGNQEDHVSMGMGSALKLKQIISNAEYIIAIELLCGAQGIDFHRPLQPGVGSRLAMRYIRRQVSRLTEDRVLATDVEQIRRLIMRGTFSGILNSTHTATSSRPRSAS